MPLPEETDKDRRLSDEELDFLMGSPLDHLNHTHVHWWEFVIAGVLVALGIILAVLGAMALFNLICSWAVG